MYKLYLDRPEVFECEVSVKNASLKNSMARLIVESTDGINLVFNGKIEGGKCSVPVNRLKGLLEENSQGNMFLEIIVEDTYFKPWKSDFKVEEHTSVKVKINEQKQPSKPSVTVKVPVIKDVSQPKGNLIPLVEISRLCEKFGIRRDNVVQRKVDLQELINEYFQYNSEFASQKISVLRSMKYVLK